MASPSVQLAFSDERQRAPVMSGVGIETPPNTLSERPVTTFFTVAPLIEAVLAGGACQKGPVRWLSQPMPSSAGESISPADVLTAGPDDRCPTSPPDH